MGRKQDYSMHLVFITLVGLGALLWSPYATIANEQKTIDGFPCAVVASFSSDPSDMTREQLFYAAHAYDSGDCGAEDDVRAFPFYKESAERGDGFAMIRLGYFYLNGTGVERNTEQARYWFRSYALAHPYENVSEWAGMVDTFFYGEPLPDLFLEVMRQATQDYNSEADVLLRNYHDLSSGNGVKADPKRAKTWLLQAMELNDSSAYYEYAQLMRKEKRESGYFSYLTNAARLNHPEAQKELGEYYLTTGQELYEKHNALVWLLRAQKNRMNVDKQIREAEHELDEQYRAWAREKAADFDFNQ